MYDLVQEILSTLRHNKLRTALTGFAVSWGIFMLIVLLSMATGVTNKFDQAAGSRDFDYMSVRGGMTEKAYRGLAEGRQITLKEGDLSAVGGRNGSDFGQVVATISGTAKISTGKDYDDNGYDGVTPAYQQARGVKMKSGRFINELDVRQRRRVAVLSRKTADVLFEPGENPVGKIVQINELSFTVVGVHDHEWDRTAYIPYTTARGMAGGSDDVEEIMAQARNLKTEADGQRVEKNLRATMARQHQFDADDQSAVWIHNSFLDQLRMQTANSVLEMAVWLIGILTLLSGIVGVSNIMFVSVRERTHEIGVRRAIGARPASILKQVMLESVAITTLFGYIGIVAGVAVARLVGSMFEKSENSILLNPMIGIGVCVEVTLVLIASGALAGLFPALKALKVKPVEALRDE